nr:WD repeat-containing protein WRAP73 [Ipomoea batatas]
MDFTEAFKQSGPCAFSPNARFLAVAVDYRLVIRDVLSLKVVQLFSCLDKITYIEWALDSQYILCGLYKRPMIQAWSLTQPEWTCKIDEGPAGISYARWSPDSRHILTTSEFQLRLTVWSLLNTACIHVQWPKHGSKGVSFTKDGKFAAICTRRDCKDYVNLLSCHTWEIMGVFAVDTLDLADIQWSPDDSAIVIWDSPLEYKVLVYSPDGRCLAKYQAYESGLGVKSLSWSPCSQYLAVGSYDQMLRVLNHLTWKVFAEFVHLSAVRGPCGAAVFKEVDEPLQLDMSELSLSDDFSHHNNDYKAPTWLHIMLAERQIQVRYDVMEVPITSLSQKPAADKPNPKQGIGKAVSDANILFSHEPIQILLIIILQNPVSSHLRAVLLLQTDSIILCVQNFHCARQNGCGLRVHNTIWLKRGGYSSNANRLATSHLECRAVKLRLSMKASDVVAVEVAKSPRRCWRISSNVIPSS